MGPPTEGLLYLAERKNGKQKRAQIEARYQKEIESIKGEVARLTNLLEQALSYKSGKVAQPPIEALLARFSHTSQNLRADSATK
jgi:hypothetical protein